MIENEMRATLAYQVTQLCGTEPAFSGEYNNHYESGIYRCLCCGTELFSSRHKYDSGTGWPSFWSGLNKQNFIITPDPKLGNSMLELKCKCGSHLGHLFTDGPAPTGVRFCINSVALEFEPGTTE